jgi:hypothetical protein
MGVAPYAKLVFASDCFGGVGGLETQCEIDAERNRGVPGAQITARPIPPDWPIPLGPAMQRESACMELVGFWASWPRSRCPHIRPGRMFENRADRTPDGAIDSANRRRPFGANPSANPERTDRPAMPSRKCKALKPLQGVAPSAFRSCFGILAMTLPVSFYRPGETLKHTPRRSAFGPSRLQGKACRSPDWSGKRRSVVLSTVLWR